MLKSTSLPLLIACTATALLAFSGKADGQSATSVQVSPQPALLDSQNGSTLAAPNTTANTPGNQGTVQLASIDVAGEAVTGDTVGADAVPGDTAAGEAAISSASGDKTAISSATADKANDNSKADGNSSKSNGGATTALLSNPEPSQLASEPELPSSVDTQTSQSEDERADAPAPSTPFASDSEVTLPVEEATTGAPSVTSAAPETAPAISLPAPPSAAPADAPSAPAAAAAPSAAPVQPANAPPTFSVATTTAQEVPTTDLPPQSPPPEVQTSANAPIKSQEQSIIEAGRAADGMLLLKNSGVAIGASSASVTFIGMAFAMLFL